MQQSVVLAVAHFDLVVLAEASGFARIVERAFADQAVDLEDPFRRDRLVAHRADHLHRAEVVEDHALARVARAPAFAQHLLGNAACGRGAFELAGSDRLLDQRVHQVAVAVATVRRVRRADGGDLPGCVAVDVMQVDLHRLRHADHERLPMLVEEGQLLVLHLARQLDAYPPLFMRQPVGRRAVAQLVPVQVGAMDQRRRRAALAEQAHHLLGREAGEDGGGIGGRERDVHRSTNSMAV